MQINARFRANREGLPVLSVQSGRQLINEVAKNVATESPAKQQSASPVTYPFKARKRPSTELVYHLQGNTLTQNEGQDKGAILNAVA